MTNDPKHRPKDIPEERDIILPPRDYQPTKAETEREYDRCCHGNWLVSAAGGE